MTVWIVDYDLPQGSERRRFYRAVQAWLRDRGVTGVTNWSTWSVVSTEDKEFAEFVYDEAMKIGRAHLYEARLVR